MGKAPHTLVQPIAWLGDRVRILDQTQLPHQEVYLDTDDYHEVASAIKDLKIRGAPAIGVAGAYAIALGTLNITTQSGNEFQQELREVIRTIGATRPTARDLFRSIERMESAAAGSGQDVEQIKQALVQEAVRIHEEGVEASLNLSRLGADLIPDNATVLTHCNTGPLAAPGYGTALGVIIYAHEQGKKVSVLADETRPLLQGARLTIWELMKAGIPVTLITDSMAGWLMKQGRVTCAIVGADRIAANGDTANKIGTYTVAVLAREHKVPFYVAAPTTTVDLSLASGDDIPIEQRNAAEVCQLHGNRTAPESCEALNPAFDVTPHRLITAIITEKGIIREPYEGGLRKIF
ncbi:S-methyl-5-thioribose-1-phosphate isomerase [Chloroflexota bacterium]